MKKILLNRNFIEVNLVHCGPVNETHIHNLIKNNIFLMN